LYNRTAQTIPITGKIIQRNAKKLKAAKNGVGVDVVELPGVVLLNGIVEKELNAAARIAKKKISHATKGRIGTIIQVADIWRSVSRRIRTSLRKFSWTMLNA
jgi:hypothetical protein